MPHHKSRSDAFPEVVWLDTERLLLHFWQIGNGSMKLLFSLLQVMFG